MPDFSSFQKDFGQVGGHAAICFEVSCPGADHIVNRAYRKSQRKGCPDGLGSLRPLHGTYGTARVVCWNGHQRLGNRARLQ